MLNYLKTFGRRTYMAAVIFNESPVGLPFIPFIPFVVLFGGFDDSIQNVNKSVANMMFSVFWCAVLGVVAYATLLITLITGF